MKNVMFLGALLLSGCVYDGGYEPRVLVGPGGPAVTRIEMERLAAAGVSEATQLGVIGERGAKPLSADDIVALKKAGATDAVISKMQNSIRAEPEVIYVEQPVVYRNYYYGPYWYPSWGFGYSHYGHGSSWGVRVGW